MKKLLLITCALTLLTACNFKEGLKETGDAIQTGTQNAVEGLKETPAAVSEASNNAEEDVKD